MPRYYCAVRDDSALAADEEGLTLANQRAAETWSGPDDASEDRFARFLQSIERTTTPSSSSPEASRARAIRSNSVRYF